MSRAQTISGMTSAGVYVPILVDDTGKPILSPSGSSGNVTGPASSTDNAIVRFDGTTGKIIQSSLILIDDAGNIIVVDGGNIQAGTTTGTQIGTSASQKLGFFGTTPIIQPTATMDLGGLLATLGLRATGSNYGLATGGTVKFDGAFKQTPTTQSANLTVTATTPRYQFFDATAAARTVTLVTAVGNAGLILTFKKLDSSANAVTVNTVSSQTIDSGGTSYALSLQNKYVTLISDGANWKVIDNN